MKGSCPVSWMFSPCDTALRKGWRAALVRLKAVFADRVPVAPGSRKVTDFDFCNRTIACRIAARGRFR
ncbi:hypothetical protein BOSE21B_110058 [Bosea sp. 21B]|nr:hypothetical protein BOSE21B_110058 [Bosea sp. 21B]